MKTRFGFVSNSSSSSFIVAYKSDIEDDELKNESFSILVYQHITRSEESELWDGKDFVLPILNDRIKEGIEDGYRESANNWRNVKKNVQHIEDGWEVMAFTITHYDNLIDIIIGMYEKKGYLKILKRWES